MKLSKSKKDIKILLLEGVNQSAIEVFNRAGYNNIETISSALSSEELNIKVKDCHILGIRSRTQITKETLKHANSLIAIGCFCIGTNQVNQSVATLHGIPVLNAPYSNTRSVAELVIAEMIMLMRGIPEKNTRTHNGEWKKSAINSYEVRGKTLGIIGYGHIGSQVSTLAENLGVNIIFYDIEEKLALGNALQINSLDELLKQSDMISLHVPENEQTKNMINSSSFLIMKQNSVLINASRGNVVDITALNNALENKKILGAAIDVFPEEPKSNKDKFSSILTKHDNVILTPHIGGSTLEAQKNIGIEVSKKLIKYSDNGSTTSSINFPDVSLPVLHPLSCRILHIHHNKTGVMREINNIISENNINIVGLYLQTNESIGYVVMDIETSHEHAKQLLNQFKKIPETIRSRALF